MILSNQTNDLIGEMKEVLKKVGGLGLSAVQLGELQRIIVLRDFKEEFPDRGNPKYTVIINPRITEKSVNTDLFEEGCISIPNVYDVVERPFSLVVKGKDENFNSIVHSVSRYDSAVVCHEVDHLDGKLFIDYLNRKKRRNIERRFKGLKKAYKSVI